MTDSPGPNVKLESLGFRGSGAMKLVVGNVTITGGASPRGFTLMFSEVTPRTATQYEVSGPTSATTEAIEKLIRMNIAQNHSSSLAEWDLLQLKLAQSRRNQ
jgi:hypothetical protein